jgi:hypothetical protein
MSLISTSVWAVFAKVVATLWTFVICNVDSNHDMRR